MAAIYVFAGKKPSLEKKKNNLADTERLEILSYLTLNAPKYLATLRWTPQNT